MRILIISPAAMRAGGTPRPASTNICCAISQTLPVREGLRVPAAARRGQSSPDRDQVKPAAGCEAAPEAMGFLKKFLMALCRASIRVPFPTPSGKRCAPRHGRRAGHGGARGELATDTVTRGVQPITMNR
jgi:hypothetical protein